MLRVRIAYSFSNCSQKFSARTLSCRYSRSNLFIEEIVRTIFVRRIATWKLREIVSYIVGIGEFRENFIHSQSAARIYGKATRAVPVSPRMIHGHSNSFVSRPHSPDRFFRESKPSKVFADSPAFLCYSTSSVTSTLPPGWFSHSRFNTSSVQLVSSKLSSQNFCVWQKVTRCERNLF